MKPGIITTTTLNTFFNKIKNVFASKDDLVNKVDVVPGKGLSTNDFTDKYKDIYNYTQPVPEEGLLALTLRGPDNGLYRLKLDENMELVLEPFINSRKVNVLISRGRYYKINEIDTDVIQLVEIANVPEGETVGVLRALDPSVNTKYEIDITADGTVTFQEVTSNIENEASYLISPTNPEKIYSFKIDKGTVYLECMTVHSNLLAVVQLNK